MAFFHSPNIVTDSLILCLDAADKVSYSGSIHGGVVLDWNNLVDNYTGSFKGGPTFDIGSGGSINFDGSNDWVELPTSLPDAPTALTVAFWVYPDAWDTVTNWGWILDSGELDVVIGTHSDDDYMYFNRDNTNATTYNVPTVGGWTHVLATWTSTSANAIVYHDGDVQSTSTAANYGTIGSGDFIGRRTGGTYSFDGKISNVNVYNRVLSTKEVSQNFNAQRSRFGV